MQTKDHEEREGRWKIEIVDPERSFAVHKRQEGTGYANIKRKLESEPSNDWANFLLSVENLDEDGENY